MRPIHGGQLWKIVYVLMQMCPLRELALLISAADLK